MVAHTLRIHNIHFFACLNLRDTTGMFKIPGVYLSYNVYIVGNACILYACCVCRCWFINTRVVYMRKGHIQVQFHFNVGIRYVTLQTLRVSTYDTSYTVYIFYKLFNWHYPPHRNIHGKVIT